MAAEKTPPKMVEDDAYAHAPKFLECLSDRRVVAHQQVLCDFELELFWRKACGFERVDDRGEDIVLLELATDTLIDRRYGSSSLESQLAASLHALLSIHRPRLATHSASTGP
jgi:hypothetical protein